MRTRKMGMVVLIVGLLGFLQLTRRPSFETIRTVDMLQLVASGACFGVALVTLLGVVRRRGD